MLPSQTSHFTQPLDDCVFRALKASYERGLAKFPLVNKGRYPTRADLVALVCNAWASGVKRATVVAAFENTGIYPVHLGVMLERCIGSHPKVKALRNVQFLAGLCELSPLNLPARDQRS